jgi:hypothetical protein
MLHKDIRKFYKSASVASHMGAHAATQGRNVFYAVANLQPWENRLQPRITSRSTSRDLSHDLSTCRNFDVDNLERLD